MYDYNQVYKATLKYFNGNELATNVWIDKYALKDRAGNYLELTPQDMHERLANEFARIEESFYQPRDPDMSKYGQTRKNLDKTEILKLFENFTNIIPQGSIMAVLGDKNFVGSLSNCVVIPPPYDSYGGIAYTDQQLAQLMKRRAGVGVDISTLRPKGMAVTNVAKTSTGAVSFMHRFSNTTREVAQAGRRGALMVTMDCRHPDILDFITVKHDKTKVTGANISVMWTDDFMQAVKNDETYILHWPVDASLEEAQFTKPISAKEVWRTAVKSAHETAEPGMIFIDTMRENSTCDPYDKILSTNPCSEIGMGNDTCRLIAINMFGSVCNPYTEQAYFDYDHWYKMCYEATRLSDDLVELELEHIQEIIKKIKSDPEPDIIKQTEIKTWQDLYDTAVVGRRIGLGFTALGDTLAALGLDYDYSIKTKEEINDILFTKLRAEWDATTDLAIERGVMPLWYTKGLKETKFTDFIKNSLPDIYERMIKFGRRNISLSTVAPTGSLSMLSKLVDQFGTTSGIEPLFAPWYTRRKKINPNESSKIDFVDVVGDSWTEFNVFHSGLIDWAKINGIMDIEANYKDSPYYNNCASDIFWQDRVDIQALIQQYVTHSISSTINLPKSTTVNDVAIIYERAYDAGLKGVTVYVDGSRDGVLVTEKHSEIVKNDAPKRPEKLPCKIYNTSIHGQYWLVLIGLFDGEPYEVFAYPNGRVNYTEGILIKRGKGVYDLEVDSKIVATDINSMYVNDEQAAATRLISTALRHGTDVVYIIEQLEKSGGTIVDFSKAVARALKKTLLVEARDGEKCPDCGSKLVFEEGCLACKNCGYSRCS